MMAGVIVQYNSDAGKEKTAGRQELTKREEEPKAGVPAPREEERAGAGDLGLKLDLGRGMNGGRFC
jgi:hypothetical protein